MVTWIYGPNYSLKWGKIECLRDEQIQQITLCAANFPVSKMSIHMAQRSSGFFEDYMYVS